MDSDVKSEEKPMPRSKEKETLIMLKYHRLSYVQGLEKSLPSAIKNLYNEVIYDLKIQSEHTS